MYARDSTESQSNIPFLTIMIITVLILFFFFVGFRTQRQKSKQPTGGIKKLL